MDVSQLVNSCFKSCVCPHTSWAVNHYKDVPPRSLDSDHSLLRCAVRTLSLSLYNSSRLASNVKSLPSLISHDVQINAQYKRFPQSDIKDIEDLAPGHGGVLNPTGSKPLAVYKDDGGQVHKLSVLCPHLKGVVCWNPAEKSWDCPVHGSRFSKDGVQLMGPAKAGLEPADASGQALQDEALKA